MSTNQSSQEKKRKKGDGGMASTGRQEWVKTGDVRMYEKVGRGKKSKSTDRKEENAHPKK